MLIMGWDGTEVTPQIKSLIEDHHLGSIILTAKNLKCWCTPLVNPSGPKLCSAIHQLVHMDSYCSMAPSRVGLFRFDLESRTIIGGRRVE